jgi:hypothetical protein
LPWGKIFKAKKIAEALWKAGKAIFKFFEELKWAKAILKGAQEAAERARPPLPPPRPPPRRPPPRRQPPNGRRRRPPRKPRPKAKAKAAKAKAATKKGSGKSDDVAEDVGRREDGPHVAMGLTDIRNDDLRIRGHLNQFAQDRGAITWQDPRFADIFSRPSPTNESEFIDRIVAGGGRISFSMRGIRNVEGMVAGRMNRFRTGAELNYICGNAAARAITTFFDGPDPC